MGKLDLKKTISALKGSFQSIDLRVAYYYNKDHWEYIVSNFRFTNKTKEEIALIHKKLDAEFSIPSFKIEFKTLDLQEFNKYWDELKESAERNLKEITESMVSSQLNIKSRNISSYLLDKDKEYNTVQFFIEFNELNKKHHERFQFIKKELAEQGRKEIYPIIEKALEINNFSLNSPLYTVVLLPIYVKISNLDFINNYLSGDVLFHKFYEDQKLHFFLSSNRDKSDEYKEFILSTDREKIKWFRYEDISNNMFKIRFTVHFEKIRINPSPDFYKIICRFSSSEFEDFLVDFEVHLNEIYKNIENIDLLPPALLKLIDPFLEINILDRLAAKNESDSIIENLLNNRLDDLKNILLENMDWLMANKSNGILKSFFLSAANRPAAHYNNYFADMIVKLCNEIIVSEILDDIDTKSKFNDLLIKFNYNLRYQSKIYYYGKRLAELREDIILLLDEIFEKYPQTIVHSDFDRRGRISLNFPKFWSEVKVEIPNSYLFCELFFFRNNSSIFNYHIIHILFYRSSRLEKMWDEITPRQKEIFIQLLNRIANFQDLEIIDYNLPNSIISKLNKNIEVDKISQSELFIQEKKKFKIIGIEGELDNFSDLNIFIGKNNRGKTVNLTNTFIKISDYQKVFNNQVAVDEFHQKYPQFSIYELYYIPHNREIDEPIGRKPELKEGLIDVLNNLRNLITKDYLKDEPIDIEDRSNEIHPKSWKIPNFLEIIDIFSIDLENTDGLTREDIDIIDMGKSLFTKFNQIWESWKAKVEKFFDDVEVRAVEDLGRGGRHKITFYDKWLQKEISNWKSFGSGTQQLLNLLFIIEFLKISPSIVYGNLIDEINRGNFETAFNQYVKDIHTNRIIFLDEPEVSLHPSLQRKFFNYLSDYSQTLQIFIATHSPFFLDINNFNDLLGNTIYVTLCRKEETGEFIKKNITKENKILIMNEIFDYKPLETAFYLSKNSYEDLLINEETRDFQLLTLEMIDDLINERKKYDPDYHNLLNLGTLDEENDTRLIQNAIFLSFEPLSVNLNEEKNVMNECQRFFLYQIHKNEFESITEKMRFKATCISNWNKRTCVKSQILTYTHEQSINNVSKIMEKLERLKEEGKEILKHMSIILFPENTLPYEILESLINYSKENNVIIVGGMEHIKLSKLKEYIRNFTQKYSNEFLNSINFNEIISFPKFDDECYINQAVVINSNGKFSFQIKNIPVSKRGNPKEGISTIPNPTYFKFITSVGNLSVFVCKDFLVNYEVIDKWMDKNKISTLLVLSFTELVNPFIYKFGNIIRKRYNKNKTIAFVNVAEYGGSGIFNLSYERQYEPGKESPFKPYEEECKSFVRDLDREM